MTTQQERVMAYIILLTLPDPPGMRRAHRITQPGSPFIDKEKIKHDLAVAYVAWRRQEHGELVTWSCVMRSRKLHLVKRVG